MKALCALGMIALTVAIIPGCTSLESTGSLPTSSAPLQNVQRVQEGKVIKLREIALVNDRADLSARPETQGRTVSQVGGAVLSAMTDESSDEYSRQIDAQEITVRFDNGATLVVTQPKTADLELNQRVKVLSAQQGTRVQAF